MLLRKHLVGSKIRKIYRQDLERIVTFELECYNELNDLVHKKLIVELMGKHSNIILLNNNDRIIDSIRHLDISMGSSRNILPAHDYIFPDNNKHCFSTTSLDEFLSILNSQDNFEEICNLFNGISKATINTALTRIKY